MQVTADEGLVALRTADWLFIPSTEAQRDPGEGSLFQKPEDVCDVFDVRTTRLEVAIELESLIDR